GDAVKAIPRAEAILPEVRALGYAPLLARLLLPRTVAAGAVRDDAAEETLARELTTVAAAAHDDHKTVAAWQLLIFTIGSSRGRPADARAFAPAAVSALARIPADHVARFRLTDVLATVHRKRGELVLAEALFRQAIAHAEAARGPDHAMVAMSLNNFS